MAMASRAIVVNNARSITLMLLSLHAQRQDGTGAREQHAAWAGVHGGEGHRVWSLATICTHAPSLTKLSAITIPVFCLLGVPT